MKSSAASASVSRGGNLPYAGFASEAGISKTKTIRHGFNGFNG